MTLKAIPDVRDVKRCLLAIKEILEVGMGVRGQRDSHGEYLDRFITYRELEDILLNSEFIGTALTTIITSLIGFGPPTEKTISAGAITLTGSNYFRFHTIDTEANAASDDLTTITGGSIGELLLIKAESGDRTIVAKNGASIISGSDFAMDNIADSMLLLCISLSVWYPLTKYNAGS